MMTYDKALRLIDNRLTACNTQVNAYNMCLAKSNTIKEQIDKATDSVKSDTEINSILSKASETLRNTAKVQFEKIVTDALQFVTQRNDVKFIIEESIVRGKPAYEFYIESTINGETFRQKPEDSNGGGIVDIVSVTLKTVYAEIFNNPKIMNACLILDEPGKMISADMSENFANYISFLGKYFNKQVIMITHNDNIAAVGDKSFLVAKDAKGVSHVKDLQTQVAVDIDQLLQEAGGINGN